MVVGRLDPAHLVLEVDRARRARRSTSGRQRASTPCVAQLRADARATVTCDDLVAAPLELAPDDAVELALVGLEAW